MSEKKEEIKEGTEETKKSSCKLSFEVDNSIMVTSPTFKVCIGENSHSIYVGSGNDPYKKKIVATHWNGQDDIVVYFHTVAKISLMRKYMHLTPSTVSSSTDDADDYKYDGPIYGPGDEITREVTERSVHDGKTFQVERITTPKNIYRRFVVGYRFKAESILATKNTPKIQKTVESAGYPIHQVGEKTITYLYVKGNKPVFGRARLDCCYEPPTFDDGKHIEERFVISEITDG